MDLETKSLEDTEIDTPPSSHKLLSFSNGAFKSYSQPPALAGAPPPTYKECMKNHAASLGGHAVDGCGEFMPSSSSTPYDPTSLKCAACGCHRNFHRRDTAGAITPPFLDFRHPPKRFSLSPSPPPQAAPISYAVFTEAAPVTPTTENYHHVVSRKRFRTKFSQEQKKRMHTFSEKMGWKMQKTDEAAVEEFCREIGVGRGVLKVWMHNNKNTFGKKEMMMGNGEKSGSQEEGESNGGGSRSEETRIDQDRCFGNGNSNSNTKGIHFQESNNYSRASSSL